MDYLGLALRKNKTMKPWTMKRPAQTIYKQKILKDHESTYVACSICRSIPESRRRCRSCIVHGRYIFHRTSTVRRARLTILDCSGTLKTRRCRSGRSRDCKRLASSRPRSSDGRKHTPQFPNRNVRGPSSLAGIGKPAGREFRNLRPASPPCRSTDRKCSFRDRNKRRLDIQLRERTAISLRRFR